MGMIRKEKPLPGLGKSTYWLIIGLVSLFVVPLVSVVAWAVGCALALRERNWIAFIVQAGLLLFVGVPFVQLMFVDVKWSLRVVP